MLCTLLFNDNGTREIIYEPNKPKDREGVILNLTPQELENIRNAAHDKVQELLANLY